MDDFFAPRVASLICGIDPLAFCPQTVAGHSGFDSSQKSSGLESHFTPSESWCCEEKTGIGIATNRHGSLQVVFCFQTTVKATFVNLAPELECRMLE